jgi:peroxiredoxin
MKKLGFLKNNLCLINIFIILILYLKIPPILGNEDLFLKIGIQSIKNKRAPNFSLRDLNGNVVEFKNFKGKLIFLTFWATWCGPCKKEMPSLEALYQQFKYKDFSIVSIALDYEKSSSVKEFIKKNGYTFPVLVDPKNHTVDLFQVKGIPTTILIDKQGMIIGKAMGPREWNKPEVISLINILLEK